MWLGWAYVAGESSRVIFFGGVGGFGSLTHGLFKHHCFGQSCQSRSMSEVLS